MLKKDQYLKLLGDAGSTSFTEIEVIVQKF